ncbi:MAG: YihY/virulence factor BrkB family protein [Bacteroidota bacterium]
MAKLGLGKYAKQVFNLFEKTLWKSVSDDITLHSAAIAFYTIFSIAPILVIIIWITGYFLGQDAMSGQLSIYLEQVIGSNLAESIEMLIQQLVVINQGLNLWTSMITTGALIFGSTTVLSQLKYTLNLIWKVTPSNVSTVSHYLYARFTSFVLILLLSLLFLASLVIETAMGIVAQWTKEIMITLPVELIQDYNNLLMMISAILFFAVLFKYLPDVSVRWRDIFIGAIVTTGLFWIGKFFVTMYLTNSSYLDAYKAVGTFVVFLIWVYYNVLVVLFGAEFTQVYTERHGGRIKPGWNVSFDEESPA